MEHEIKVKGAISRCMLEENVKDNYGKEQLQCKAITGETHFNARRNMIVARGTDR